MEIPKHITGKNEWFKFWPGTGNIIIIHGCRFRRSIVTWLTSYIPLTSSRPELDHLHALDCPSPRTRAMSLRPGHRPGSPLESEGSKAEDGAKNTGLVAAGTSLDRRLGGLGAGLLGLIRGLRGRSRLGRVRGGLVRGRLALAKVIRKLDVVLGGARLGVEALP